MNLTDRQQEVLTFIQDHHARHGIAPSTRVTAEHFAVCQTAIKLTVDRLVAKGALQKCPSSGRIIIKAAAGVEVRADVLEIELRDLKTIQGRNVAQRDAWADRAAALEAENITLRAALNRISLYPAQESDHASHLSRVRKMAEHALNAARREEQR